MVPSVKPLLFRQPPGLASDLVHVVPINEKFCDAAANDDTKHKVTFPDVQSKNQNMNNANLEH